MLNDMAVCGVIGQPVAHSLSPVIHQAFAKDNHIALRYEKYEATAANFAQTVATFFSDGGLGLNVTLPFKSLAFQLADDYSQAAKAARAASCLWRKANGKIYADNFDGAGLIQDLLRHHDFHFCQKRVLIIGAGGACQGILPALLEKAPLKIVIANRDEVKAQRLVAEKKAHVDLLACGLSQVPDEIFDIVINATSAGHAGLAPDINQAVFSAKTIAYDLSYRQVAQQFLQLAKRTGVVRCVDGIGMLAELNALTFYLWHGIYPETHSILDQLAQKITCYA